MNIDGFLQNQSIHLGSSVRAVHLTSFPAVVGQNSYTVNPTITGVVADGLVSYIGFVVFFRYTDGHYVAVQQYFNDIYDLFPNSGNNVLADQQEFLREMSKRFGFRSVCRDNFIYSDFEVEGTVPCFKGILSYDILLTGDITADIQSIDLYAVGSGEKSSNFTFGAHLTASGGASVNPYKHRQ